MAEVDPVSNAPVPPPDTQPAPDEAVAEQAPPADTAAASSDEAVPADEPATAPQTTAVFDDSQGGNVDLFA